MLKYLGTVTKGVVVFENGHVPPEGTVVDVVVAEIPAATIAPTLTAEVVDGPDGSLSWLLKYAGIIDDMPADFAAQHDHYIHGTPKR